MICSCLFWNNATFAFVDFDFPLSPFGSSFWLGQLGLFASFGWDCNTCFGPSVTTGDESGDLTLFWALFNAAFVISLYSYTIWTSLLIDIASRESKAPAPTFLNVLQGTTRTTFCSGLLFKFCLKRVRVEELQMRNACSTDCVSVPWYYDLGSNAEFICTINASVSESQEGREALAWNGIVDCLELAGLMQANDEEHPCTSRFDCLHELAIPWLPWWGRSDLARTVRMFAPMSTLAHICSLSNPPVSCRLEANNALMMSVFILPMLNWALPLYLHQQSWLHLSDGSWRICLWLWCCVAAKQRSSGLLHLSD